jgi:hypothetical protein
MPSNERVVNKALTGTEVKELMRRDFDKLIAAHGLLSEHIAYGRLSYSIDLTMNMDNPMNPEATTQWKSNVEPNEAKTKNPKLNAVEPHPLQDMTTRAVDSMQRLVRNITSPNRERVRGGMPVPVEVRQQDGTTIMESVTYPEDTVDDEGDVTIKDLK